MGVNSLPKIVTRQRRDCDLNSGPFCARVFSTLTTRLPSHPIQFAAAYYAGVRQSVYPIDRRRPAGLLLSAPQAGYIDR